MLPNSALSSTPQLGVPQHTTTRRSIPFVDYCLAVDQVLYQFRLSGTQLEVSVDGTDSWTTIGTIPSGATRISAAFDQNMRPYWVYTVGSSSFFRWFDTTVNNYVLTEYADTVDARCVLDEHRTDYLAISDIILTYTRGGNLYARQQRTRFQTELLLKSGVLGKIIYVVRTNVNRLQWKLVNY